jgi:hypothetical protein
MHATAGKGYSRKFTPPEACKAERLLIHREFIVSCLDTDTVTHLAADPRKGFVEFALEQRRRSPGVVMRNRGIFREGLFG